MNCPECGHTMRKADFGTSGDDPRGHWVTHDYQWQCPKCDYMEPYTREDDE